MLFSPFQVLLGATFFSACLTAGTCEIQYERTACPGKESISYKKCDGEKNCSKFIALGSVAECRAAAVKSCANDRLTVTKMKAINAVFDGAAITTESGKSDFCEEYDKRTTEYNQC
jgi:hypothetical protein